MSKVRINDLAREMEVKSRQILDILAELGLGAGKTHSSSLEEDEAEKVRVHLSADRAPAATRVPRLRAPAGHYPQNRSLPCIQAGDALKAVLAAKLKEEQEARLSHLPVRTPAVRPLPLALRPPQFQWPPPRLRPRRPVRNRAGCAPAAIRAARRRPSSGSAGHCLPSARRPGRRQGACGRCRRHASGSRRGAARRRGGQAPVAPGVPQAPREEHPRAAEKPAAVKPPPARLLRLPRKLWPNRPSPRLWSQPLRLSRLRLLPPPLRPSPLQLPLSTTSKPWKSLRKLKS